VNLGATRFGVLLDAIDAERSHLACKLHDTIVQNLAAISINLALLDGKYRDDAARDAIEQCAGLVDESIREIRRISYQLSPVLLPEADLSACVESLREFSAAIGIGLDVDMSAVRGVKLGRASKQAFLLAVWDCARGMAEGGAAAIRLDLRAADGFVRVQMNSKNCSSKTQDSADTLYWWIVQERIGRIGGQVTLDLTGGRQQVEFAIPAEEESWAAAL
jgi:signal transduction histidine kinase